MTRSILLGVDIGTYSTKGVLVDSETGAILASHNIEHNILNPKPGHVEHDAEKVWWCEFVQICRFMLASSGIRAEEIKGVGVSGIGVCVLPVDKKGNPLRSAILYGVDTRATKEIGFLDEKFGRENILQKSGSLLSSQAGGPKILWIRNNESEIFEKAEYFLTCQSFVVYRLTGCATIDFYTGCVNAPLIDIQNRRWDKKIAESIVPIEKLPGLKWSCEIAGYVSAAAAVETGLAQGIPVITGTADAAAEAISCGLSDVGEMMLMFGSSNFFILKTDELIPTRRFWSGTWLDDGGYTISGGMSTTGSLTRWFKDVFNLENADELSENIYETMEKLLDQSPSGAKGLIALPYFEGERTPIQDPEACGVFFGLHLNHNRADIYRALLESVGFGIRHNLDALREEGIEAKKIIGIGGGTRNLGWMQLICDIAEIEMTIPSQQIGACFGDAFMAGVGVGLFKDLSEIKNWVKVKNILTPDEPSHKKYIPYYRIYRDLYERVSDQMHELSRITGKA